MQLGWWHVLQPDHLPHIPSTLVPLPRTLPEQRACPLPVPLWLSSPTPHYPFVEVRWTKQKLPGCPVLRVDSSRTFNRLRIRAVKSLGTGASR